jgi:hypothetical protein
LNCIEHNVDAIVRIASNQNGDAIEPLASNQNGDAIYYIASNLIWMQYSPLHQTIAVAIDVLHQHDLDAISYFSHQPQVTDASLNFDARDNGWTMQ